MAAEAPLTPQMRALLARIARANRPPLHTMSPQAARAAYAAGAEILDFPREPLGRVESLTLPNGRPARLYAADAGRLPVLLYLHGGGFTVGGLETHDALCRQIARRAGVAVLALDYRLAPEHRFPAAVDDCWQALQWLQAHAMSLGLDADRLAVGGDSAGGTLAAVAALMARDAGLPLALQVLITPGTSAYADTESHERFAQGYLIDALLIDWFFSHYIDAAQRGDWRFAPLEAPDLDGVAPAWFALAECDPLVDEGLAYADRLRLHSVPVDLELYRGVTHDFIKLGRVLPEAAQCHAALAAALRRAFGISTEHQG
jgi:acetyl esterase